MSARPPVMPVTPADVLARLLAGQPAVPARSADSERRERSSTPPNAEWNCRTYGDVLADDPIEPFTARHPLVASALRARSAAAQLDTSRTSFSERGQLGTSSSITTDDGLDPIAIYADDAGAHTFRREVAKWLERLGWSRRANALLSCGEAGARCDCGDCGTPHVLPYRCGARSCPTCSHSSSAIQGERCAVRAERAMGELRMAELWEGTELQVPRDRPATGRIARRRRARRVPSKPREKRWKHVVLTTRAPKTIAERYDPETMRAYAVAVRRAVGAFWRSTPWGQRVRDIGPSGRPTRRARRDTLYIVGIEAGVQGMIHVHMAVFGEFVADWYLAQLWKAACRYGGFVKVRSMVGATPEAFRKALREVLKYVTKGDKEPGVRAQRAAAVEYAFRGIRRVEMAGAIRLVPNVTAKDVATASRECVACGGARSWRWRGMRAPDYVRRNRGFGVSHIVDDADAEFIRVEDRELAYRKDHARRADRRDAEQEHRPGGRFYGGSPPPWIDDADEWETVEVTRELPTSRAVIPVSAPRPHPRSRLRA